MRTLQECQDELIARGVLDVKFFWALDAGAHPRSEVENSVAEVLSAYLDGKTSPMPPCNDKPLVQ